MMRERKRAGREGGVEGLWESGRSFGGSSFEVFEDGYIYIVLWCVRGIGFFIVNGKEYFSRSV